MELRHIRYFLAVAEEKNFSRAAEKLLIAQPPLSRQIQDLEAELGCKLFIRSPHSIKLTNEGELFYQYATQIIELVNRSKEDVAETSEGLSGTLYLATVEGMAPSLFVKWIKTFKESYPHVTYNLWNGNTDDVISRLEKGLCELAIITAPYDNEEFEVISLSSEAWVAVMPSSHPLSQVEGEYITPDMLLPYELLIPSRESRKNEFDKWFEPYGKTPAVIGRIAHMFNAYELSRNNIGIAIYPESIKNICNNNDICIKKIKHKNAIASYALIYEKKRTLSRVAKEFLDSVLSSIN